MPTAKKTSTAAEKKAANTVKKTTDSSVSAAAKKTAEKEKDEKITVKMPSLQALLEAGAHFGHRVSRWNPGMEPYIFDKRNGMHVIDLTQTVGMLEDAVHFLAKSAKDGNILIVGTKGQAATIIKNTGVDHGAFYISRRWPGGLLTNFKVVRRSVIRLMQIEDDLAAGRGYETKRERLVLKRERDRLVRLYEGIRFMEKKPAAMIVIDTRVEKNAIKEARKVGVPVVALMDTNCDPRLVEHPIPGNDDAIKSIELFVSVLIQGFSNAKTSADLIGKRNDYHAKLDDIRKRAEAEEERKRKEKELEQMQIKAMKEGKSIEGIGGSEVGKVVRIVQQDPKAEKAKKAPAKPKKAKAEVSKSTKAPGKKVAKAVSVKKVTKKATKKTPVKKTAKKAVKKTAKKTAAKKTTKKTTAKKAPAKKKTAKKATKKTAKKTTKKTTAAKAKK